MKPGPPSAGSTSWRKADEWRFSKFLKDTAFLTIGHSTRTIEEFIRLLRAHAVTRVVDVRTVPRSRRNPQFNSDALAESLRAVDTGYVHMASLGGLRHTTRDSPNTGWRNASFRGYAD